MSHGRAIVTDLDECLLDAKTHRWDAARPALLLLKRLGIPLVLCSSKTRAEMELSRLSAHEVKDLTGLAYTDVERARQREHDEPFVLESGDERAVREAAERRGLRVTHGGRFHHLTGTLDKGKAVRQVLTLLGPAASIGLGDAETDLGLLGAVDRPILMPRSDGEVDPTLAAAFPGAERAPGPGPEGWNEAALGALGG